LSGLIGCGLGVLKSIGHRFLASAWVRVCGGF
jgi:hypothetical protein